MEDFDLSPSPSMERVSVVVEYRRVGISGPMILERVLLNDVETKVLAGAEFISIRNMPLISFGNFAPSSIEFRLVGP